MPCYDCYNSKPDQTNCVIHMVIMIVIFCVFDTVSRSLCGACAELMEIGTWNFIEFVWTLD